MPPSWPLKTTPSWLKSWKSLFLMHSGKTSDFFSSLQCFSEQNHRLSGNKTIGFPGTEPTAFRNRSNAFRNRSNAFRNRSSVFSGTHQCSPEYSPHLSEYNFLNFSFLNNGNVCKVTGISHRPKST